MWMSRHVPFGGQFLERAITVPSLVGRVEERFLSTTFVFHARHIRDLYKATLLQPSMHFLLNTGPPSFDGGRSWGVIERALSWLLPRESAIRRTWDLARFLQGL